MNKKSATIILLFVLLFSFTFVLAQGLPNPWPWKTVPEVIDAVIEWFFDISLIICPLMIVIGGFFLVTSAGEIKRVDLGKKSITYAVIGFLFILSARSLIDLVISFTNK
jgi:hypothetical protein